MIPALIATCLLAATPALPPATVQALQGALADERKAEALYLAVIRRHGDVRPFSNIVQAEARHQSALLCLLEAHGVPAPPNPYSTKPLESPATVREAALLAIRAEEENIALYDGWLATVQEPGIRATFERLRWASQERHLPALKRQLR
jgi:hypothetical protein